MTTAELWTLTSCDGHNPVEYYFANALENMKY